MSRFFIPFDLLKLNSFVKRTCVNSIAGQRFSRVFISQCFFLGCTWQNSVKAKWLFLIFFIIKPNLFFFSSARHIITLLLVLVCHKLQTGLKVFCWVSNADGKSINQSKIDWLIESDCHSDLKFTAFFFFSSWLFRMCASSWSHSVPSPL